ncbi:MAG: cytochrome c biogenesis protein CcdA [Planctomycetota bacterium]
MRTALTFFLLLTALTSTATAQMFDDDPVSFEVAIEPAEAGPGDVVTVLVKVRIEPPWHIYGMKRVHRFVNSTTIEVTLPDGFTAEGEWIEPKTTTHHDESLDPPTDVPWHTGDDVVFRRQVRLPQEVTPGEATIGVKLSYSACDASMCLDPAWQEGKATLTLVAESKGATAGPVPAPEPDESDDSSGSDGTPASAVFLAFLGGLGSILLPCVYPLIPLTIAFFTKHEGSRASAVFRAMLFCVGILITFTGLGIALGPAIQALANSLWLNLFLFLLMVVLALSLLGMFDIQLPSSWTGKMQSAGSGASILAPVAMGVAFSLASFSCTVGVIGPVLAGATDLGAASTQMFAYSVGFALPFFLLALFPMLISAMPRGGGWMNTLKVMLGFFEICFAGYYLWKLDLSLGTGLGGYGVILSLWIATTAVAGLYLLGKVVLPKDPILERIGVPRGVFAILFFAAALFMFAGLMGTLDLPAWMKGLLPPAPQRMAGGAGGPVERAKPAWADEEFHAVYGGNWWTTDHERALELGSQHGKRVLFNFTGIFCTNCRTMEGGLFLDPDVMAEFDDMVLADLYTDIPTEEAGAEFHTSVELSRANNDLRYETYDTVANPFYVIFSPEGEVLATSGYLPSRSAFLEFLRSGK